MIHKKLCCAALAAGLLLAGCTQRTAPDAGNPAQGAGSGEQSSSDVLLLEGYYQVSLGDYALSFPEETPGPWLSQPVEAKDQSLYSDGWKLAELTAVTSISNTEAPFADCDQLYTQADPATELSLGNYPAKSHFIQEESKDSAVGGFKNTIHYCIAVDDKLITISFHPAFGVGIGTQREWFEDALKTISKEA